MFLELHILQNFAPSNLNRDDTGSPKSCEFGGYRRGRISSQSIKRAVRLHFGSADLISESDRAVRTKRLTGEVARILANDGKDMEQARRVAVAALSGVGIATGDDGKTQYLLYLGQREIERLVSLCREHWDGLTDVVGGTPPVPGAQPVSVRRAGQSARDTKRSARDTIPQEARKSIMSALDGGKASDLALFGRMLADLPGKNIDAASQVAHALSTNVVSTDFDYFTAIDDLQAEDTAGADMIGTVEFNSACFYRYSNVDLRQLRQNLQDDHALAASTTEAFIRASVAAIPSGKQNSFAAQNPPAFVLAVVRKGGLWSLANAFVRPVRPDSSGDLIQNSISGLDSHWAALAGMYGLGQISSLSVATLDADCLSSLKSANAMSLDDLIVTTMSAARPAFAEA